tara:strand:+ start:875 stop:1786 length:912 start_codon:yes stop_codon:yes gene_type:complete
MNKNYFFFPDINKKSGYGHFFRSIKYTNYIKEKKTFLIKNELSPNLLKKLKHKNINYILLKNLKKLPQKKNILLIDSYQKIPKKISKFKFYKIISIIDKKPIVNNSDIIIDHTFKRKKSFYNTEIKKDIKCFVGISYFPIDIKKTTKNKYTILINFGGVNDIKLINKSLKIVSKLECKNILILSKFYKKTNLKNNFYNKNITIVKYIDDMNFIYSNIKYSIGAAGISLYEKIFNNIPTISSLVVGNQINNYKNFSEKNLLIKFNNAIRMDQNKLLSKLDNLQKRLYFFNKKIDNKLLQIFHNI